MVAEKPSRRSPTRSSPARSRAGSEPASPARGRATAPGAAPPRRSAPARGSIALLQAWDAGRFPSSIFLDGPSEALKGALLGELKRAWAAHHAGAPPPRVFRAAEAGVDQILAAYQSASLFSASDLVIVLDIEDLGRSEKKIAALAGGLATHGESCLALVESAAESPRKSLDPLRRACAQHVTAAGMTRAELRAWGERALARESVRAEAGVLEAVVDACEGDPLAFFNELDKLLAWAGPGGAIGAAEAAELLRPVVGADLPEYLGAVALGHGGLATQRLGRLLATGVSEGTVLFALSNLVGGALGGWARYRELSEALRRRSSPRALDRALDAVYRAETAWKTGRADVVALLEHTTRALCGAG